MRPLLIALLALAASTHCLAEASKAEADFFDAVRNAIERKNVEKYSALHWWKGSSDEDRENVKKSLELEAGAIDNIVLEPLPAGFQRSRVHMGKRVELTCEPKGLLRIKYKPSETHAAATTMPYAVIDGAYYLVGIKTTDLHWAGPRDKGFNVMIMGPGADKVRIHLSYNASGVDVEEDKTHAASYGFFAQFVNELTVTSSDDDTDVTVELKEMEPGPSTKPPIYQSEPLKGKGQVQYLRPR